jgi:hypothetical protein
MRLPPLAAAALLAALPGQGAEAQVLKDLPPIRLEYRVYLNDATDPAGDASISFEPVDTARGRRLEVRGRVQYMVGDEEPVEYRQEASLTCDAAGVEKFEAFTRYAGEERRYVGTRIGIDYHITVHHSGGTLQKTETAGVQRTNWGLFCGGFLSEPLTEGEMLQDYPMLFPSSGRHFPRQKFRTARVALQLPSNQTISVVETQLARLDSDRDRLWNRDDPHEALIRLEEHGPLGLVTYELAAVNGAAVDWVAALPPRNLTKPATESTK